MLFGETWLGMFGFVGLELLCFFHIVSMDYSIQMDGQSTRCCSTAAADAQIPYVQPLCELGCGGDHTGTEATSCNLSVGCFWTLVCVKWVGQLSCGGGGSWAV